MIKHIRFRFLHIYSPTIANAVQVATPEKCRELIDFCIDNLPPDLAAIPEVCRVLSAYRHRETITQYTIEDLYNESQTQFERSVECFERGDDIAGNEHDRIGSVLAGLQILLLAPEVTPIVADDALYYLTSVMPPDGKELLEEFVSREC